jgi:uncharacterized protein YcbK (DUF882 family)
MQYVKPQEVLMGREVSNPLTPELTRNLDNLLISLNKLRAHWGKPLVVTSGYRPAEFNKKAGGAKSSSHMTCEACDFRDSDGSLDKFLLENQQVLIDCGLYLEHPDATPGWCHVQTRPPKSGNRVFRP